MADSLYPKYTLMHKNVPVAEIELDNASCSVSAIGELYEESHVPVGQLLLEHIENRVCLSLIANGYQCYYWQSDCFCVFT